ncbi:hypothetical protein E2C01_017585 [Portunus trituberculatus]|uniref:Uncharacterized protein n=1 Tax=Portunus trituberculatus TaxID=210409 RepID=A0A5B7DU56_PORTR|nr:hypothetical protein [Portunus trituberculatus]
MCKGVRTRGTALFGGLLPTGTRTERQFKCEGQKPHHLLSNRYSLEEAREVTWQEQRNEGSDWSRQPATLVAGKDLSRVPG